MACATVASVSVAALAPAQVWETKSLSRQGLALAAPGAKKMVANRSRIVMRYVFINGFSNHYH